METLENGSIWKRKRHNAIKPNQNSAIRQNLLLYSHKPLRREGEMSLSWAVTVAGGSLEGKMEKRETHLFKSRKTLRVCVGGRALVGVMVNFMCQLVWAKGCLGC